MHTSIGIVALACLALAQSVAANGRLAPLCWLAILCFATSLSDDIFLVLFTFPALAMLLVARLLYAGHFRRFGLLFTSILVASVTGHFLAPVLSPFEIDPGTYTHFHAANAAQAWRYFLLVCHPGVAGDFVVYFGLDAIFVLFATALLIANLFRPPEKRAPLPFFMLAVFCACLMDFDWGAAILTGNFTDMFAIRHVRLAILLPFFVVLGLANHAIPWSRAGTRAAMAALSLAVCACAIFLAPAPDSYFLQARQIAPQVAALMEKEHIEAGLADYWHANPIFYFSNEKAPVRSVNPDGSMFHWLNSSLWFAGDGASDPPPRYRLVFMANLDPNVIRRRYGEPAQVIPGAPGADIWIYPPERSIVYNPVFGALSNGPADKYRLDGDMLPSLTGRREGNSRVARAGRDTPGLLFGAPYPSLRPVEGRYRLTLRYTWRSAPAPGKGVDYEATYSTGNSFRSLDHAPIPFIDTSPHEFTREIVIPDDKHDVFRMRGEYGGSGDIAIDGLEVVYLGK
jgi:hypothetical protein